jgi:hypothetical protein
VFFLLPFLAVLATEEPTDPAELLTPQETAATTDAAEVFTTDAAEATTQPQGPADEEAESHVLPLAPEEPLLPQSDTTHVEQNIAAHADPRNTLQVAQPDTQHVVLPIKGTQSFRIDATIDEEQIPRYSMSYAGYFLLNFFAVNVT